jgi:ABC-2 type transport system ATP-binding protein
VDGVSFTVDQGEYFGVLGPNGAAKTTTLELIEGLRQPDAGRIRLLGEDPWPRNPRLLPRIGVQLQASAFFDKLSAREQLETFGALYGVPAARTAELLELVGLTDQAGTRDDQLSGGQRQRLSIACALVHDPEVLFLDEAEALCDRVAIMDHGRILAVGAPAELVQDMDARTRVSLPARVSVGNATLEDVFLQLTGREYRA